MTTIRVRMRAATKRAVTSTEIHEFAEGREYDVREDIALAMFRDGMADPAEAHAEAADIEADDADTSADPAEANAEPAGTVADEPASPAAPGATKPATRKRRAAAA